MLLGGDDILDGHDIVLLHGLGGLVLLCLVLIVFAIWMLLSGLRYATLRIMGKQPQFWWRIWARSSKG